MKAGPTVTGPPYDPAVALARVQAAGPKLLEACEVALAYRCGGCQLAGHAVCWAVCENTSPGNILRAAIAEAKGKDTQTPARCVPETDERAGTSLQNRERA